MTRLRLLFLCTGNSCRSQMAEGWARALHGAAIEAHSAGIRASGLDQRAVAVMREAGVDIAGQRSKTVAELKGLELDGVITVCGDAHETCPVFPGAPLVLHAPFDDPPRLVPRDAEDEAALVIYRRVRDEIRQLVETLPQVWRRAMCED